MCPTRRFLFAVVTVLCSLAYGEATNSELFSREKMQPVDLERVRVWLGQPVQITAQLGWQMSWTGHDPVDPQWAFIHLTPFLARFPKGNLIATYALDTDSNDNPLTISGYQISKDGGAHWGRRYSVLMQHEEMVFIPKAEDTLLAVASEYVPAKPGDEHNLVGPCYRFEHGGDRMEFIPEGVRIIDWPWAFAPPIPGPQPRESWEAQFSLTGSVLEVGNRLLATAYACHKGDPPNTYTSMLVSSEDGGYTWRYYSTIARSGGAPGTKSEFNDANETSVLKLATGDLMAVFRTDRSKDRFLRRCYSHDQGRKWTSPEEIPAYSVFPQLLLTRNKTTVLTTGRPGIDLWLSTDPEATTWQKVDLMAHHNRWAPDNTYRIEPFQDAGGTSFQTCSYTAIVEVAPNRLLIVYDRDTERAPSSLSDLSRLFVMPVEIERK